jgi:predicted NBD/HSP70 family sugar kinase
MTRPAGSAKLLRAINSSAALAHLLREGRLTRAELRERTGLSKPTSSEMLRLLSDAGLAVVAGRTAGAPGPTAEIYAPNPDAAYAAAISVRDTTEQDRPDLAVALCDLTGVIRDRAEVDIDFSRRSPGDAVAAEIIAACRRAGVDPARVRHVQIGVAGSYDARSGTIHHTDVPGWDAPGLFSTLRARLASALGAVDVAIDNDVNLAAVAERHRGVAARVDDFVLLWLGHGIGLATVLGGDLLRGARGGAGEIGYLPLAPGPDAIDLQDFIGGPAVMRLAAEQGGSGPTAAEALRSAADTKLIEEFGRRVAFAIAAIVSFLDPPLIVLAGEVAQAGGARLRDAVAAAIYNSVDPLHPALAGEPVEIAMTAVDDDAVLLGGLDAALEVLRESLISSLAHPTSD